MPELSLILFEDRIAREWEPFALTRPAGELLHGTMTLRARAERAFRAKCVGYVASEHLRDFEEPDAPPVITGESPRPDGPRLYLLSRFLPDWVDSNISVSFAPGPVHDPAGNAIGWFAASVDDDPPPEFFLDPRLSSQESSGMLTGRLLERVWDIIPSNPDQIARDIEALFPNAASVTLPPGCYHWGRHPLIVDPTAIVEPETALDTTEGPIWIDRGAHVRAFTRLAGPAYIGIESALLGGSIEASSLGPVCRVHGELAESICIGYVNKQHDGHMGHACLGRWVNLGAETSNSDLKNNYGTVRMWTPSGEVDTKQTKMGCLVGDHVKTGIGTLLNTGTVIGAGSNLYGTEMPPRYVPPFSWGTGHQLDEYRLDQFLEVASRSMARRDISLSEAARRQLERAWARGRDASNGGDSA